MRKTIIYFAIILFSFAFINLSFSQDKPSYQILLKNAKSLKYNEKTLELVKDYINRHFFILYDCGSHFNYQKYKVATQENGISEEYFKVIKIDNSENKIKIDIEKITIGLPNQNICLFPLYYNKNIYLLDVNAYKKKETFFIYFPYIY